MVNVLQETFCVIRVGEKKKKISICPFSWQEYSPENETKLFLPSTKIKISENLKDYHEMRCDTPIAIYSNICL